MTRVLALRLLPTLAALAAGAAVLLLAGRTAAGAAGGERLPDLDQATPSDLVITRGGSVQQPVYRLGFRSAIANVGDGPLIIDGHRSPSEPMMTGDQIVERDGAPGRVVPGVATLRFTVSRDHRHWHLLGFDRYELRRAGSAAAVVQDKKTGFCVGDRYPKSDGVPGSASERPRWRGRCGLGDTGLLGIQEGISVGWGDDYDANLEGQYLLLSGLAAGRYVLVQEVNADRRLQELYYGNNAASLLLDLRWRHGIPEVRVVRSCPETDRCDLEARPRVGTVARGLAIPWDIAFLPDGRALVNERPGRVRLLSRDGRLQRRPVATVRVSARGEGGLLGLAVDPRFSTNRFVYLYYTTAAGMRLERRRFAGGTLHRERSLVEGIAAGAVHDSGRIAFGPDERLYIATGDAGDGELAQRPDSLNGKLLALTPDEYRGDGGRPVIIASGLRNPQGFDWEPGTGRLLATDHGPSDDVDGVSADDEVNAIAEGADYGWPRAHGIGQAGFAAPLELYRDAVAPSGATFVTGPGSAWTGSFVFACLRGAQLRRLTFSGARIVHDEPLLAGRYGRLRTVVEGPGGALYALTSNRDGRGVVHPGDDRILRIDPPRR